MGTGIIFITWRGDPKGETRRAASSVTRLLATRSSDRRGRVRTQGRTADPQAQRVGTVAFDNFSRTNDGKRSRALRLNVSDQTPGAVDDGGCCRARRKAQAWRTHQNPGAAVSATPRRRSVAGVLCRLQGFSEMRRSTAVQPDLDRLHSVVKGSR